MSAQVYSKKCILRILGEGCLRRSPTEQAPPAAHYKAGKCPKVIMAMGMAESGEAAGGRTSIFEPKSCIECILTFFFLYLYCLSTHCSSFLFLMKGKPLAMTFEV